MIEYTQSVINVLPLFRHYYHLSRKEALALPHWEFQMLARSINQLKAEHRLSIMEMTNLGFNGVSSNDSKEYVKQLRETATGARSLKGKTKLEEVDPTAPNPFVLLLDTLGI